MSIADELAAEKAKFVSLCELLETLAEQEGCTVQDVAQWLIGKMDEAALNAPKYMVQQSFGGMKPAGKLEARAKTLMVKVAHGKPEEDPIDEIPF